MTAQNEPENNHFILEKYGFNSSVQEEKKAMFFKYWRGDKSADEVINRIANVYSVFLQKLDQIQKKHPDIGFSEVEFKYIGDRDVDKLMLETKMQYQGFPMSNIRMRILPEQMEGFGREGENNHYFLDVDHIHFNHLEWNDYFMPEFSEHNDFVSERAGFLNNTKKIQIGFLKKSFLNSAKDCEEAALEHKKNGKQDYYEELMEDAQLYKKEHDEIESEINSESRKSKWDLSFETGFFDSDFEKETDQWAYVINNFSENLNEISSLLQKNKKLFEAYKNAGYSKASAFALD
ncbi:MAG: hypothetical protein KDJ35_08995 [Alphaproteobacteria bacterium]|nr:hypothetical protein [Alphaproteobacteria bacterium]